MEYNHVRSFEVVGIDKPEADAFAPGDGSPPASPNEDADSAETADEDDESNDHDGSERDDGLPETPQDGIPI